MPTDPMTTIAATDQGAAWRAAHNANAQKRHWWHLDATTGANVVVDDDTEQVDLDVDGAPRLVTFPAASAAPGQEVRIYAVASDVTNTITATPDGSDTIGGASTQVLNADDEWIWVQSDGVSDWRILVDGR